MPIFHTMLTSDLVIPPTMNTTSRLSLFFFPAEP